MIRNVISGLAQLPAVSIEALASHLERTCNPAARSYTPDVAEPTARGLGGPSNMAQISRASIHARGFFVLTRFGSPTVGRVGRASALPVPCSGPPTLLRSTTPAWRRGWRVLHRNMEAAMPNILARPEQTQSAFLFSPRCAHFAGKRADHPQLRWIGDGIGLDASQDARISFLDKVGRVVNLTLAETLARADAIDAPGLHRILVATRCAFGAGDLAEADARVWRKVGMEVHAEADGSLPVIAGAA